jgi:hypothetical protein
MVHGHRGALNYIEESKELRIDKVPIEKFPAKPDKVCAEIFATRGLAVRIAKACGLHRVSVYGWRQVPPRHVQAVAKVMDRRPEDVRPDIFKTKKRRAKA